MSDFSDFLSRQSARSTSLDDRIQKLSDDIKAEGLDELAKYIDTLLTESEEVITNHPRVVSYPNSMRPTGQD